jgi:hypothetical protein
MHLTVTTYVHASPERPQSEPTEELTVRPAE